MKGRGISAANSGGAGSSIVARPLDTLAQQINQEHALAEQHARTALEHARNAGTLLLEAKALCEHGTWGTWLKDNFNGGERTAQMYMRVASRWPEIEANPKRVSDLSLRRALELLTTPQPAEPLTPKLEVTLEQYLKYKVMPEMTPEQYAPFKQSIAESGVLVPVDVDEEGNVLDGHERVRAWQELRREGYELPDYPRLIRVGLSHDEKVEFALKNNLIRQHLTTEEVAEVEVRHEERKKQRNQYREWLKTAQGLLEIRDRRLYRETHEDFTSYLCDRFGMTQEKALEAEHMADDPKRRIAADVMAQIVDLVPGIKFEKTHLEVPDEVDISFEVYLRVMRLLSALPGADNVDFPPPRTWART